MEMNKKVQNINKEPGNILGLRLTKSGYGAQVDHNIKMGKIALSHLRQLHFLTPRAQLSFYKLAIRPLLAYPPVPLNTIARTPMLKLQRIQNKALRMVFRKDWNDGLLTSELHSKYNLPPLNIFINRLADNIWQRVREIKPEVPLEIEAHIPSMKKTDNIRNPMKNYNNDPIIT